MKILFKYFFKLVHLIVGPAILLWEWLTTPEGISRSVEEQRRIDEDTRRLVLYQFRMCPFCVVVRRTIKQLSLNIEIRDAGRDPAIREQLLEGGGLLQVPCLKITDARGNATWMYESLDIIEYLQQQFT